MGPLEREMCVFGGVKRQQEMIAAITAIFKHAFPLI